MIGPLLHSVLARTVAMALFFCSCTQLTVAGQEARAGEITVLISDSFGSPLREFEIDFYDAGGRRVARLRSAPRQIQLPLGRYRVKARASLCAPLDRTIEVQEAEVLVVVSLTRLGGVQISGEGTPLHSPLKGKVQAPPGAVKDVMWVRIHSLLGEFTKQMMVSPAGHFTMPAVPNGSYMLTLFSEMRLVANKVISPDDVTGKDREVEISVEPRDLQR